MVQCWVPDCNNNVVSLRHAVHQLENCIFDICDGMRRNALKLNEEKTEFVIFSTKNNLRDNQCLVVGKELVGKMLQSNQAIDIDNDLSMHIQRVNLSRSNGNTKRKLAVNILLKRFTAARQYGEIPCFGYALALAIMLKDHNARYVKSSRYL